MTKFIAGLFCGVIFTLAGELVILIGAASLDVPTHTQEAR